MIELVTIPVIHWLKKPMVIQLTFNNLDYKIERTWFKATLPTNPFVSNLKKKKLAINSKCIVDQLKKIQYNLVLLQKLILSSQDLVYQEQKCC